MQTFTTVNGYVTDMSLDGSGNLLYCTEQKEIGRINTSTGATTILANAGSGPFANGLRGVVTTPSGDIAVIDNVGDIYRLPLGVTPAVKVYSDLYMVSDPTDLIVDAAGNYVVTSQSPTSGSKAINWINSNGQRWAYYLVKHTPVALAYDPITNNLLMADAAGTGAIRMVDAADQSHPTSLVTSSVNFGFNSTANDGDMAVESNGNILVVANGKFYRYDRNSGVTTLLDSGIGSAHGLMIAVSSPGVTSSTGYSAFIASANSGGPTTILEYPGVDGPSTITSPSLGTVPGKGTQLGVLMGMNVFKLVADEDFNLLVGGDLWGANQAVKRINTTSLAISTIANQASGISSRVVGLAVANDRSIYLTTTNGAIQKIVESPLSVSTIFSDPSDQILIAEDMVYDRNGVFYVAARQGYSSGYIAKIENGNLTYTVPMLEPLGMSPDPISALPMYTEWVNVGFSGRIGHYNPFNNTATPIPNFDGMNYSNGGVWADGDAVEDIEGNIYTCSEDDFSVHRFNRYTGKLVRIASGFLNHPSGVAIARSTPASGSTTGWSLYITEYNYIYEIASVPAPVARVVDPQAPGVGHVVAELNGSTGLPRSIVSDPTGNGFYVSTIGTLIEHYTMSGVRTVVANSSKGLVGDLTGIAVNSAGHLIVCNRFGSIWDVDPNNNFTATLIFSNPGSTIFDARSILVDGQDRILIFDRPSIVTSPNCGKLWRLESGVLSFIAFTNRGYRGGIDPLSGDVFVPETGNAIDGGGEILRIDEFTSPATAGHYRGAGFFTLKSGANDGGISFSSDGTMYVPVSSEGRVYKIDRATGVVSLISGNYDRPVATIVAPGTNGIAGAQGSSLFILDRTGIYEVGVTGYAVTALPQSDPQLDNGADLKVTGSMTLGGSTNIQIKSPGDANRLYLVVASLSGKVPGLVFSEVMDPLDPRVLPNNPDDIWMLVNDPLYMPDFVGFLDANGESPLTMQLLMPNDPNLVLNQFLDLAWISLDSNSMSGIATVGGTAQIFLGY